jgi:hypothetical protein
LSVLTEAEEGRVARVEEMERLGQAIYPAAFLAALVRKLVERVEELEGLASNALAMLKLGLDDRCERDLETMTGASPSPSNPGRAAETTGRCGVIIGTDAATSAVGICHRAMPCPEHPTRLVAVVSLPDATPEAPEAKTHTCERCKRPRFPWGCDFCSDHGADCRCAYCATPSKTPPGGTT